MENIIKLNKFSHKQIIKFLCKKNPIIIILDKFSNVIKNPPFRINKQFSIYGNLVYIKFNGKYNERQIYKIVIKCKDSIDSIITILIESENNTDKDCFLRDRNNVIILDVNGIKIQVI